MKKAKTSKRIKGPKYGLPPVVVNRSVKNEARLKQIQEEEKVNWAESLLGIPSVWKKTMGKGVRVAVLDTGVDPERLHRRGRGHGGQLCVGPVNLLFSGRSGKGRLVANASCRSACRASPRPSDGEYRCADDFPARQPSRGVFR